MHVYDKAAMLSLMHNTYVFSLARQPLPSVLLLLHKCAIAITLAQGLAHETTHYSPCYWSYVQLQYDPQYNTTGLCTVPLQHAIPPSLQTTDLSNELSELQSNLQAAVKQWQQDRPSYPEESSIIDLVQDGAVATLLQLMERKELTHSVHKLHVYRRKWRGDVFGSSDDDDLDVLFYTLLSMLLVICTVTV